MSPQTLYTTHPLRSITHLLHSPVSGGTTPQQTTKCLKLEVSTSKPSPPLLLHCLNPPPPCVDLCVDPTQSSETGKVLGEAGRGRAVVRGRCAPPPMEAKGSREGQRTSCRQQHTQVSCQPAPPPPPLWYPLCDPWPSHVLTRHLCAFGLVCIRTKWQTRRRRATSRSLRAQGHQHLAVTRRTRRRTRKRIRPRRR